jgi:hypothetical protein
VIVSDEARLFSEVSVVDLQARREGSWWKRRLWSGPSWRFQAPILNAQAAGRAVTAQTPLSLLTPTWSSTMALLGLEANLALASQKTDIQRGDTRESMVTLAI